MMRQIQYCSQTTEVTVAFYETPDVTDDDDSFESFRLDNIMD